MNIHLIRLGGVAAGVAGALRVLTSVLSAQTGRILTLYLIIDVLLVFGCVGFYEFYMLESDPWQRWQCCWRFLAR